MDKKTMALRWSMLGIGALLSMQNPAFAMTVSEAVDQTIKTAPDVLIDADHRLALDHAVDMASGGYRPKVDLGLGIGREWSENISTRPGSKTLTRREASLTLSQMLYDGYETKGHVERSQADVESAAHKVGDTSERMGLGAVEAFLNVLRRQELLKLIQDNLAVHERTLEQIKLRADSGVGRAADLEQAQARVALAQANLAASEANLREANIKFQRIVGVAPDSLAMPDEVSCDVFAATLDDAVKVSLDNNPAVKSAIAAYEASQADERVAEAAMRPRADLNLGTSFNNNLDGVDFRNNDAYAMARLKYNVYKGGSDEARIAETRRLTDEAKERVERVKREVEKNTQLAWNQLETSKDRLPKLKVHVDAALNTRDAYSKQFSVGQRTLIDLLDSENELYTARSDYVNEQYDERFARYQLMASLGKLLETLGVEPREESKLAEKK